MRKWTLYDAHLEHGRNMICMSDDGYYWAYDKFDDVITFGINNHALIQFNGIDGFKHDDTSYMLYMFERFITWFDKHSSPYICGKCHHLIFRDYRHHEGLCNLIRIHRNFEDICVNEDIAENDRIRNE